MSEATTFVTTIVGKMHVNPWVFLRNGSKNSLIWCGPHRKREIKLNVAAIWSNKTPKTFLQRYRIWWISHTFLDHWPFQSFFAYLIKDCRMLIWCSSTRMLFFTACWVRRMPFLQWSLFPSEVAKGFIFRPVLRDYEKKSLKWVVKPERMTHAVFLSGQTTCKKAD